MPVYTLVIITADGRTSTCRVLADLAVGFVECVLGLCPGSTVHRVR